MLELLFVMATAIDTNCEKMRYRSTLGQMFELCPKEWDRLTKGIYQETCENGVVVYFTPFHKNNVRVFKETLAGQPVSCKE